MTYRSAPARPNFLVIFNLIMITWSVVNTADVAALLPSANQTFNDYFFVTWAQDHVTLLDTGTTVQLKLDNVSGCGFASKASYLYGYFSMELKLVAGDSAGTITSFYLASAENPHEELDFEFLGNNVSETIILQTNVFANGTGGREQRFNLWFDPAADFHTYSIIWNSQQVIFYVDSIPIRVYPNKTGAPYPSTGHMYVDATLYDGSNWATNGGQTKVNWTYSPFIASYRSFFMDACVWSNTTGLPLCSSMMQPTLWWDGPNYQKLNAADQNLLELARSYSLFYDYCNDTIRYPIRPPECS